MNAIHWVFGTLHNWIFGGLALVLLTCGLTVTIFRHRKYFEPGLQQGHAVDPAQVLRDNPPDPER